MAKWSIYVNDRKVEVADFPDNYVEQDVLHYALEYVDIDVIKEES